MNIDMLAPQALAAPAELFADLRRSGPVVWSDQHKAWIITTYDSVVDGFRDARALSSDRLTPLERRLSAESRDVLALTFGVLRGWMTFHDAPRHGILRDPVRLAFTPRRISRLQNKAERITKDLLDDLATRREFDLKQDFAFHLPAVVIAEMLGIPPADRDKFKTWSRKLAAIVFGESRQADQAGVAAEGAGEFVDYFGWLIAERASAPGDDLISALIAARRTEGQPGLSDMEVIGACTLLLFAGHETTTNLITNAVLALLQHPGQVALLREQPELTPATIEELLRFDGPVKVMVRTVAADHERAGVHLTEGQIVYLGVLAANHDPAVFPEPSLLDLRRRPGRPNMAFGQGAHYCLGHALARLEASVALRALFSRFPEIELSTDELEWEPLILTRSLRSLPVRVARDRPLRDAG
ncbi:MAG: cytochrome P450 [Micromonosporaceae bacterium]